MSEATRHPFLNSLSKHRGAPPTILVIFGASGDLARRKLAPAIYNLACDNLLPSDFYLIGFGRSEMTDEAFRSLLKESIEEFSRRSLQQDLWTRLEPKSLYLAGNYDDENSFARIVEKVDGLQAEMGREPQLLFYISTPPSVFEPILHNLGTTGLASRSPHTPLASKVIIEKPFGHNLKSAQALNRIALEHFNEQQVYRIDHYLGKETVQDLLVHRFANAIFEPVWNREFVDCVQITVAEELGVGTRGGYYDKSGALRDMIQNHTMQLLALIAMEPPVSLDPEAIRDEKVKVMRAIQAPHLDPLEGDAVRAQYSEGLIGGRMVKGYRDEEGVPDDSLTETYAALRLGINNWRWKGVPFYLRSGKRMTRRVSEIAVQFKRPPGVLFTEGKKYDVASNTMVFRIQPDEGVTLLMNSKIPGLETRTQPVKMHFRYATTFGSNTPEAYERLILDSMTGDSTLFIRSDEAEASWKLISPILEYWSESGEKGLESYHAGSWGPLAAERLLWDNRHEWRRSSL